MLYCRLVVDQHICVYIAGSEPVRIVQAGIAGTAGTAGTIGYKRWQYVLSVF